MAETISKGRETMALGKNSAKPAPTTSEACWQMFISGLTGGFLFGMLVGALLF